jgi:hypothetical protein
MAADKKENKEEAERALSRYQTYKIQASLFFRKKEGLENCVTAF